MLVMMLMFFIIIVMVLVLMMIIILVATIHVSVSGLMVLVTDSPAVAHMCAGRRMASQ